MVYNFSQHQELHTYGCKNQIKSAPVNDNNKKIAV